MTLMDFSTLQESKLPSHIQVIYSDKKKLFNFLSDFINAGLELEQFCYIGVTDLDSEMFTAFTTTVKNFHENIDSGNLIFSVFGSHNSNIIDGDMSHFESLKKFLEKKIKTREEKYIRFIGDMSSVPFYDGNYEECVRVEEWFQKNPFEGCYVCHYDSKKLEKDPAQEKIISSFHEDVFYC